MILAQSVTVPLPDSTTFQATIQTTAFPQIIAFSSACIGVIFVILIIRALVK
jgi:hypothetical protein